MRSRKYICCLFFVLTSISCIAQSKAQREKLKELLQIRKERFDQYTSALDDPSGFFGNHTKRDLKEINAVLTDILRTDNRIMYELDRMLDHATYEGRQSGRNIAGTELQREKFVTAIDTLNKQIEQLKKERRSYARKAKIYSLLNYMILAGIVIFVLWRRRRKKLKDEYRTRNDEF